LEKWENKAKKPHLELLNEKNFEKLFLQIRRRRRILRLTVVLTTFQGKYFHGIGPQISVLKLNVINIFY
jgi:hypothetical protein